MSKDRSIPVVVQAVDAFGREAVEALYPNWQRRNDLQERDFVEIAKGCGLTYATDGRVLLPVALLEQGSSGEFEEITSYNAFELFGLEVLADVSEHGHGIISKAGTERYRRSLGLGEREPAVMETHSGVPSWQGEELEPRPVYQ